MLNEFIANNNHVFNLTNLKNILQTVHEKTLTLLIAPSGYGKTFALNYIKENFQSIDHECEIIYVKDLVNFENFSSNHLKKKYS